LLSGECSGLRDVNGRRVQAQPHPGSSSPHHRFGITPTLLQQTFKNFQALYYYHKLVQ
jgi:hypothetical protein